MRRHNGEVRFSLLKNMARSPAHYRAALDETNAIQDDEKEEESKPAQRFGTLSHTVILGGDDFAVFPGPRRSGKVWDAFKEKHSGSLIVTASEHKRALELRDRVFHNEHARRVLTGRCEHELFWEHGGRKCGGRLDVLGADFIADLKTTTNANPRWFARHALKMQYHAQLDWYAVGARSNGHTVKDAYIVAVEIKPPFAVTVMRLTSRAMEQGAARWGFWLEELRVAEDSNYWPAYTDCVVDLDLPDEDDELIFGDEQAA